MILQQGDVLIETVNKIPERAKPRKDRVLAEGEATGHFHRAGEGATVLEDGDDLFLLVKKECQVTHEEHGTITVPPGEFRVRRVREYDHWKERADIVKD